MYYNDFAGWVREQLDAGPYRDDTDAARKLGVPPPTVTRWLRIRYPTRATTRQVATLFDVPIDEVLVAGGYMTPDEATSVTFGPGGLCAPPCSHTYNTATTSPNPPCSDSSPSRAIAAASRIGIEQNLDVATAEERIAAVEAAGRPLSLW